MIRKVTEAWDQESITWNNQPSTDDEIVCEKTISVAQANTVQEFDITGLVRKWYQGDNHGLRIETASNTGLLFYSSEAVSAYRPSLVIRYVSMAGLETHMDHESFSAGRAGEAYVTLFNGNQVVHRADTAMSGLRMPVSLSHYYNSCYYKGNTAQSGTG